jgi:hypothetical protein
MPTTDHWKEKLQCPKCGKTGMASMMQIEDDRPIVESVPAGFKVVNKADVPDFCCTSCNVAVIP